jgi:hypothetical protein
MLKRIENAFKGVAAGHRLRRLVDLPRNCQESVLRLYAKSALPNASPEEVEELTNQLRAQLRREHTADVTTKLERAQKQLEETQVAISKRKRRHPSRAPRVKELHLVTLRHEVRQMSGAGYSQAEMCKRLTGRPRPLGVSWRALDWVAAYHDKKYGPSVRKWLSHAAKSQ